MIYNSDKPLKVASLFSGCGGMDLGFAQEGYKIAWANDIDHWACETYRKNIDESIWEGDIADIDKKSLADCEVMLGGFPCQDFSIVWERPGLKTPRGNLYLHFVEAVSTKKPLVFVAENVKGLMSANKGKAIKKIISDFEECGYNVDARVYNFADYGVPQLRKRVIIVGIRRDLGLLFVPPKATHNPGNYVNAETAFKGVEAVLYNNEHMKIKERTREMLKMIPEGGNFADVKDDKLKLNIKLPLSLIYRRLDRRKPAYTVVACGGGGTWSYHYEEPRPLTNRERARLQTFPDDFIFCGSTTEARKQIGNAVPPLFARILARHIKAVLTKGGIVQKMLDKATAKS